MVRAEFGKNLTHVHRATDWAQAGGGLLDLGIYCLQFISMVFGGQKPEKISAVGRRHETGTVYPGLGWLVGQVTKLCPILQAHGL